MALATDTGPMTNDETQLGAPMGPPLPPPSPSPLPEPSRPPAPAPHGDPLPEAIRRLLRHDGTALAIFDSDRSIRYLSESMLDLIGAAALREVGVGSPAEGILQSFLGQAPTELLRGDSGVWNGHVDHRDATGRKLRLRATVSASHDPHAAGGGELGLLLYDVTESNDRMRALLHHATHDPLTGLANRQQMLHELSRAIAAQRERPGHMAVTLLDVDNLQYVNDAFGHAAGDRLLVSSARRLERVVRPTDDVARVGGDEFLVIAGGVADAAAALDLADRARRALTGRLRVGQLDLEFSVSVGVALADAALMDLDDRDVASILISNADTAMHQSKQNGRARCTLFTSRMRSTARGRIEMANALRLAITEGGLGMEYQPIHSSVSGAAIAAEALVRWEHPTIGRVGTSATLEVAEASGAIQPLGEFVLECALADLARWQAEGTVDSSFAIHVDVSHVQLGSSTFVDAVTDRLRHHQIDPARLVLHMSRPPISGRDTEVSRSIRALRRTGVRIAIADLGTGTKTLAAMTEVGADVLRIDGALALPSDASTADHPLVRAVVLLAHAVDMDVVAVDVSAPEQLRHLRAAGCDMLQGSLLGNRAGAHDVDFSTSTLS